MRLPRGPLLRFALFLGAALLVLGAGQVRADDGDRVRGYRVEVSRCVQARPCRPMPLRSGLVGRFACQDRVAALMERLALARLPARTTFAVACVPVPGFPDA